MHVIPTSIKVYKIYKLLETADVQQQGYAVGYQFYVSEKDNTAWWVKTYAKNVGN